MHHAEVEIPPWRGCAGRPGSPPAPASQPADDPRQARQTPSWRWPKTQLVVAQRPRQAAHQPGIKPGLQALIAVSTSVCKGLWPTWQKAHRQSCRPCSARAASGLSCAAIGRTSGGPAGGGLRLAQVKPGCRCGTGAAWAGAARAGRWRPQCLLFHLVGIAAAGDKPQVYPVLALVVVIDPGKAGDDGSHGLQLLRWHGHGRQQRWGCQRAGQKLRQCG